MSESGKSKTAIKICDFCGVVHADDMTCPLCELMEFIMTLKEPLKGGDSDVSGVSV